MSLGTNQILNAVTIIHVNCWLLISARKRAVYDQFGEEGLKNGVPQGSGMSGAWTHGYTFHGNADKVFRNFFGGDNPFQGRSSDPFYVNR